MAADKLKFLKVRRAIGTRGQVDRNNASQLPEGLHDLQPKHLAPPGVFQDARDSICEAHADNKDSHKGKAVGQEGFGTGSAETFRGTVRPDHRVGRDAERSARREERKTDRTRLC